MLIGSGDVLTAPIGSFPDRSLDGPGKKIIHTPGLFDNGHQLFRIDSMVSLVPANQPLGTAGYDHRQGGSGADKRAQNYFP